MEDYERMKNAIIDRLKHRQDFVEMDLMAVERIARLYADWLWIEESMSSDPLKLWGHSKLLNLLDAMLNRNMAGLGITPTKRREILNKPEWESDFERSGRRLKERDIKIEGSATTAS
jgi:hypothetical protein